MLLAYIDEIGETGAFVSRDDPRFNTSPAFGYAGFVVPAESARLFGAAFQAAKRTLYREEIALAPHPGRWERKGSSIFRPDTPARYPEQLRVFNGLVRRARDLGARLFYYADEKPLGTPKQTQLDTVDRETRAMRETLNRIARHADTAGRNVMVVIDQVNEKTRSERVPAMYGHILGRAVDFPEMRRIIEPPMHVDSVLSANIQFADWIAACVSRAVDYHLVQGSVFGWVTSTRAVDAVRGAFTAESKLRLWNRSVADLHHSELFGSTRPLYPAVSGQMLAGSVDPATLRRIRAAAERARPRAPDPAAGADDGVGGGA
ncbi:MAG: DUF3800 domain-containing protein [Micrococcales bacterium]|nr:DUF3800 domain-containing protein [Micrococcales bacterium]